MSSFPRVIRVQPLPRLRLRVAFDNGDTRLYDCAPLLDRAAFAPLRTDALFRAVQPDPHGYGVIWNDDIDLAESELWLNGAIDAEAHEVQRESATGVPAP
jgi:hypothetical protein